MSQHTKRMKRLYSEGSEKRAPWQVRLNDTIQQMREFANNA